MKKEYRLQFFLFVTALTFTALISLKLYFRIDATKEKTYTLSAHTRELLDGLDGMVQVTWFKSGNVYSFFPSLRYLSDMLTEYALHSDGKLLVSEKSTESLSEEAVNRLGLVPRQIETQDKSAAALYTVYSGLMIEYKGQTRLIPFIDDIDILEYDVARFISDIEAAVQGNVFERNIAVLAPPGSLETDYAYVYAWLEYAGFQVHILQTPLDDISAEIPLLVIGSDYIDFSSAAAIDVFLKKEGMAVFFVSGNKIDTKQKWTAAPKTKDFLLDMLAGCGFYIQSNLILDPVNFRLVMSAVDNTGAKTVNYPFWIRILQSGVEKTNPVFAAYSPLQMFWPSSITADTGKNKTVKTLAVTSPDSAVMVESYDTDPFGNQMKLFEASEKASETVIAGYEKPSRVIVISDEYMISRLIDYTGSFYNLDFLINCIEYICGKDNLVLLKNKKHTALPFKRFDDNAEFNAVVFMARLISFVFLPALIVSLGAFMFVAQRRKK